MTQINLRPYQIECLTAIKSKADQGIRRQIVQLATGAGKTVIFGNLIKDLNCRALVLAHTSELLEQAKEKIEMICPGLNVGIVNAYSKEFDAPVVVSSIQAANQQKTLESLCAQNFSLLVYDEAHHAAAESPRKIISALGFGKDTQKLLVGFTATAFRQDGKGLGEIFDEVTFQKNIKEMISEGYLVKPRGLKVATDLNLGSSKSDDFEMSCLSDVMDTPEMSKLIVDSYVQNAGDLPAIAFGVSIDHAKNLAESFQKQGIASSFIHGEMAKEERAQAISAFREGNTKVLCNCMVLTEGFDAPETSCIIMARPTKSTGLYQQCIGRGLRLWPNKQECIVLDFGDVSHSICNTASLLHDAECEEHEEKDKLEEFKKELLEKLPPTLNRKLKAAIFNIDMLGQTYSWERTPTGYFIRGGGKTKLEIVAQDALFNVILSNEKEQRAIATGLSFEYAFAAAEDFAKENSHMFMVSDMNASWRDLPITERQEAFIRGCGYRAGIENLTRGQASLLISSGALQRAS